MIETILLDYLTDALDVPVYMEKPKEYGDSFVVLERTGGREEDYLQSATIAIQSYGGSLYKAAALAETVKSKMLEAVQCPEIASVKLNSIYNFSNNGSTSNPSKQYCYQSVFEVFYY